MGAWDNECGVVSPRCRLPAKARHEHIDTHSRELHGVILPRLLDARSARERVARFARVNSRLPCAPSRAILLLTTHARPHTRRETTP